MIELLWCDGTWSTPQARSLPSEALRRSLNHSVKMTYVDYPADFGPATGPRDLSHAESVAIGMRSLAEAVRRSPHRVVVGGYSQGAGVAVRFAREILPKHPDLDVLAVATMGDPYMPTHERGRSGIAGPLWTPRPRLSVWVPGDPIADLPAGSPLRGVADLTEWMSIRSPEAARRWGEKTLAKLATRRAQAWWAPWRWRDIASAVDDVLGYLGTKHSTDYARHGHATRLARMIERAT